ncbi:MAG: MmgE/PrpD family protein [Acidobacteria bacterium]|nr:MAG: MmgE/PrpD family protein [Acidobacteriota bacterium]
MLAGACRPWSALAADQISPAMARLSAYMSEARNRALPEEVVEKVKQHVLDTIASMVSGAELPPGRAAIRFARSYGGEKIATVVASNVLCGPVEAALANGVLAQADETDDSHAPSLSHPGCAVVPAALAAGERFAIDGAQFLRAVVLGYDVGTRISMTLGGQNFMNETHRDTHSLSEGFGAAAAAASLANLNAQQMRWVLDYAAQQSSGIAFWQRDTEHIEKAFVFGGMPARDGVTAALLVRSGWSGVNDAFSGTDNFLLASLAKADPAGLVDKLGERYEVVRTNIKKWTVGSPIQAPLDALENIRKKRPFEPDEVKQVTVHLATDEASVVNNRDIPDICLQYMLAVMLIDKTASFHAAHDKARMQDPAVLHERSKIQLFPDAELEELLPKRVAVVEVTFTDGTQLSERVDAVRGTAENPMSREEVVAKARDLMALGLGAATSTNLINKLLALETVKDIRELRPLLQRT